MSEKKGNLSINSENMFPIIKKWLYSDHDIFYRELVSNGCDAITKLRKLDGMGEYALPDDYKPVIKVIVDPESKTIRITDNGIGMDADEVEEYINQVAFSGATDFVEKYKDKTGDDQIIGHFGLGFYSSFMVADEVHIDTLSYKEGAAAVHWECTGGAEFTMSDSDKTEIGTTITLFLNEDCLEFCNEYKAREVIRKYCGFMPFEIYLARKDEEEELISFLNRAPEPEADESETEPAAEDGAKEEDKASDDKEKEDKARTFDPLNETVPLWTRHPNDCTREEYLEFYRKLFNDYKEPLFWIHLNMDYPFNLKGILFFPKINTEYDSIEGTIKLYNSQVFVADNIKEVIPEYLMLLKGVIDCPDLPLNVSRSALQNDGFVKKISEFISKKVADKLSGMCKTEKEEYEKYWDDIAPFIKYGCLRDDKFCEKMTDYILFKNIDDKYMTLPECLEVNKIDPDDEENQDHQDAAGEATDESGEKVEAEEIAPESDAASEEAKEEEPREKTIYYVTDPVQQSQYVNMFRQAKMDAVILTHNIDQPFISQLEARNEGIRFQRIDADLTDAFKSRTSKKAQEEYDEKAGRIAEAVKKALKKKELTVQVSKLKNKKISSLITLSEETRRMQDMMKAYSMPGMGAGMFGMEGEGETLVLNANHPLVQYVMEHEEGDNVTLICEQLYDLAKLQQAPLEADAMTRFVQRSNEIMMNLV